MTKKSYFRPFVVFLSMKDAASLKETRNSFEEDLLKMRNNNAVQDLQVKELQGELEVEQNFATLYKTQVRRRESL